VKVIEYLLIFLIIFSPVFYGSVTQIPLFIVEVVSLCAFLFLVIRSRIFNHTIAYPAKTNLLLISLLLILLQMVLLPNPILKIISPHTQVLRQQYDQSFNAAGFSHLSFYSLATLEELIKLISFFLVFVCALNVFQKREQFERVIIILIFLGFLLSFYGIISKYFILQKQISRSFGTFGNRNHFASYMIMIAPLSIAYALYCRNRNKKIIFTFIAAIICSAVFLSVSRGGSISLIISLFLLTYFMAKEKLHNNQRWLIAAAVIFALVLVYVAGFGPIQERMGDVKEGFAGRWRVATDSFRIVKDFPFFGVGLGNFKYIFTLYQKARHVAIYYDYLHNDYLQFIVEAGLAAAALLAVFFINIFRSILSGLNKRHDSFAKSIVIGGFCGMLGGILHSFVDFNFHIPAIAFLFWFLLGLTYKCVSTHFYPAETGKDE